MISLTDNQINEVYDLLLDRGMSYETLRDELLDHICCIIEEQMERGAPFQNALSFAHKQFGPLGIERTQEATIFLLTLKLRKMKKTSSILGIIGGVTTILGTLFKVMHWPGANVMLLLGLAITGLLFMPFALYVNYKSKDGIKDRATIIAGFVGAFMLTVFSLFKIMHWPGASVLMLLALGELIIVFIPLYFIKSYRNPENRWFDVGSLTVIMAGVIMVLTLYSFHGPSTGYIAAISNLEQSSINSYKKLENEINAKTDEITSQNQELKTSVDQLNAVNRLLVRAFYQYRNQLLNEENQPDFSYYNESLEKLKLLGIDQEIGWNDFIKQVELLNKVDLLKKNTHIAKILTIYPSLAANILGKTQEGDPFNEIRTSIENLPIPNQKGYETNVLYVSYLNLVEFEIRNYQLELLNSL